WPPSLKRLKFEGCFDQPIEGVVWPRSARVLKMEKCRAGTPLRLARRPFVVLHEPEGPSHQLHDD
ncbi:unnamed protein product, partial [Ectocarpus sp. 4 AP-2014]